MKNLHIIVFLQILIISCDADKTTLSISVDDYRDKMKGAWVGQMAGVGWGLPTEFDYIDAIIPDEEVPEWKPEMVNQQGNDDLYVEMTFLQSMEKYGLDVSIRQAGLDFANTGYTLWAANFAGRENLRYGIAPPESSHPKYNKHCDDIDYQIEADFSGIIAPGMPNVPIRLGEKFGRLMNYGDGMYAGQFVGGMYSAAYFNNNIESIIAHGLACIPSESLYAKVINDVIQWHKEHPDDWQSTWRLIMDKYFRTLDNQPFHKEHSEAWVGIDAKVNGAFIVLGLLYGEGDMEKTIRYSMQCGLDSDCNPSNAAGILGTMLGYSNIPDKFKSGLDVKKKFSYSNYDFNKLLNVSEQFTREYIHRTGGEITVDDSGNEFLKIAREEPVPSRLVASYQPGPVESDNRYNDEEMNQIKAWSVKHFQEITNFYGIDMQIRHCGKAVKPKSVTWNGTENVILTTPMSDERSVRILINHKLDSLADDANPYLIFQAGHEKDKKWQLQVRFEGQTKEMLISDDKSDNGWHHFEYPFNPDGSISIDLQASNIDENAINYWSGFRVIYTQIERLRSNDEEKVSISPYPFGEMQHFLCRG